MVNVQGRRLIGEAQEELEKMDVLTVIAEAPLFRQLDGGILAELAADCSVIKKREGQVLVSEGDSLAHCYLLVSGKARSYLLNPDGKRFIVKTYQPGHCLAITTCLGKWRFSGTLEITEDATLIVLPLSKIEQLAGSNIAFCQCLLQYALRQTQRLHELIKDLNFGALTRLARHLFRSALEQSVPTEKGLSFTLKLRKNELAEHLGITPETLSRMFAQLQSKGVIEVDGQTITVLSLRDLVYSSENLM